ncbi:hypothetical protein GCM10023169_22680 [Georgenia halophila]|uniref:Sec-independent protein translocase protein TatA n=1 Tax=Georgenia halophila TaxID=620889 RepID=A0ABP8LAE1_9MICO
MLRNGLQPTHILILVLVIVLIFGATKLPSIAENIGKSLKVFKKEVKELRDDTDVSGESGATSSYTATGGQPPQQGNGTYDQRPPDSDRTSSGASGAAEHPTASTPPKS